MQAVKIRKIFWHANWRRRNLDNTNSVPQRGHKDSDFGNMAQIFVGLLISRLFRELYLYMLKLEWAVKISSNIEIFFSPFGICGTKIFAPTLGKLVGPLCARFAKTLSFSKIDFCAGFFYCGDKILISPTLDGYAHRRYLCGSF